MARPGSPRSLAGDGEAAGGHGLPDVPGQAFGPAPPPVDQQHDGGQARTVTTTHTDPAFLRGWKRSPARQPGERGNGARRAPSRGARSRWVINPDVRIPANGNQQAHLVRDPERRSESSGPGRRRLAGWIEEFIAVPAGTRPDVPIAGRECPHDSSNGRSAKLPGPPRTPCGAGRPLSTRGTGRRCGRRT
jgi:hypothetical protein